MSNKNESMKVEEVIERLEEIIISLKKLPTQDKYNAVKKLLADLNLEIDYFKNDLETMYQIPDNSNKFTSDMKKTIVQIAMILDIPADEYRTPYEKRNK